jgi:hypothetical protein
MQLSELQEIVELLPEGRTRFYYFKDRYALLLLELAITGEVSKKDLKQGSFGRLLEKEVVKDSIRNARGSRLCAGTFASYWPLGYECYFLTLAIWGGRSGNWWQTSRPGHNLVLQLNFSSKHNDPYRKLIDPERKRPFEFEFHPVAGGEFDIHPAAGKSMHTLAWSRLDLDLGNGEALIEEIQTDWVRWALLARRLALRAEKNIQFRGTEMQRTDILRYVDSVLRQHQATWDEAMLSATIWFLHEMLGVRQIYYHTYESGIRLKRIDGREPPRSIYTRLPRRFCFQPTDRRPAFLPRKAKSVRGSARYRNARFSVMDFERNRL